MSERLFDCPDLVDERGASLSPCGRYRYKLWRRWDWARPAVLFVMLNPSTADAERDDPTIRKCIGFARRWGMGGIRVVNLYAWRATKPTALKHVRQPVGEDLGGYNANDLAISAAASDAGRMVVAWGSWPGPFSMRTAVVQRLLAGRGDVEALKLTKDGQPWHPLMCPYAAEPVTYWPSMERAA